MFMHNKNKYKFASILKVDFYIAQFNAKYFECE